MTTQEFVKKEAQKHLEKVPNGMVNAPLLERSFANGLTKGLEIAEDVLKWAEPNGWHRHEVEGDTWFHFQTMEVKTTSELLSIYLTEINEKK